MTHAAVLAAVLAAAGIAGPALVRLPVPVVRQARERCGPAALAMVMRFYGADSAALAEADRAYDPILKGSLITDLAGAARRAGFAAVVAEVPEDSVRALIERGVPPILLYQRGVGPLTVGHYGVLVGWDAARGRYAINDGGPATRTMARADLMRRWHAAGSLALVLSRPFP